MPLILKNSREEIKNCSKAVEKMINSTTFREAESAWFDFLAGLERIWNKTLYNMQSSSRFKGWYGQYKKLRKDDELLSYLKNARDAREHTISQPVGIKFSESGMAKLGIKGSDGSVTPFASIPSIRDFWEKSGVVDETIVHVFEEEKDKFKSKLMMLNTVHNRGRSYSPPHKHLGKKLVDNKPIIVAKLGLIFYQEFIQKVELEFKDLGI